MCFYSMYYTCYLPLAAQIILSWKEMPVHNPIKHFSFGFNQIPDHVSFIVVHRCISVSKLGSRVQPLLATNEQPGSRSNLETSGTNLKCTVNL